MLRASLRSGRSLLATATRSRAAAQLFQVEHRQALAITGQRWFADNKRVDGTVLPGSDSKQAAGDIVPPPPALNTASPNGEIPTTAPLKTSSQLGDPTNTAAPEIVNIDPAPVGQSSNAVPPAPTPPTGTGSATVAPPSQPPKKPRRRFFRFLVYLTLLSGLGYAGGVYYSLVSDNFHDFFTEYVPGGEDAVAYFEEREFRKRFPGLTSNSRLHPQVRGEEKVKVPSKSGISARPVKDERTSDLGSTGKHMSAVDDNKSKPTPPVEGKKTETPRDSHTHDLLPKESAKPAPPKESKTSIKAADSKAEPVALIDNLTIPEAEEPAVQDLVKIINDIITVVNADGASGKYSSAITKAKGDLSKVVNDIKTLKAVEQKAAVDQLKNAHLQFDDAAKELVMRLEREMHEQETHFKEEYETERERLAQSYQTKLKTELEAAEKVFEQKLKNKLLEQSVSLQRKFTESLQERVEQERNGRLSKLNELSSSVQELEKLTGDWNEVVDANLRTQHLIVAVEAVRATLEKADRPRPFVEELAALKEVAADDAVVNAAIASINPVSYQRGIPTSSQLIDRFRRVASEVRKAALLPENAGIASHLASAVLSKVMFKKQGLPVGDDVESVLTRTEVLLEEGDLDGAAREMNGLHGWAKLLARDWLTDCRRVLEVKQALDVVATEARLQSLLLD